MGAGHERALRLLFAAHGPTPPTDDQMDAFLLALVDLPGEAVFDAVVALIRRPGPLPSAGDVRAAVLGDDDGTPGPAEAWDEVAAMVRAVGWVRRPKFSHELIGRAVEAVGGWAELCASETPAEDRGRFLATYARLAERDTRARVLAAATEGDG